ncbi:GlsB/YeaQ/YmgE family stress response membrane protein [Deinococcus sp.]|uniref:GlsB/YeaQ/YmgE family stress response membrane protein n=1 Tax=Deinococcus sp. TaxID=47478 RepID=UPI0025C0A8F6|nr:GlsB/YeaQ/YmgE family stress response membrane protein [Deinococcus sp.]
MGWIGTILIGALCGWLASMVMKTDAQQGAVANILIGIVGAFLANLIFGSMLHIGSVDYAHQSLLMNVIWGVLGSVVLIAILKALRILR